MLIYKQRYKPRTTREFTKSDLTVYDSAGNTALNALTVYSKSEVVDGAIKSAGEGYGVLRLADLTPWGIAGEADHTFYWVFNAYGVKSNGAILSNKYITVPITQISTTDKCICINSTAILIRDTDCATVSDFVASLGDATLCYELADPTQGNCIAIKTDNGTGINGTMATFTTGTPLRGITGGARDVMTWDGSAGTVTKVLSEIDLGTLNYYYDTTRQWFQSTDLRQLIKPAPTISDKGNLLCPIYTTYSIANMWRTTVNNAIGVNEGATLYVRNSTYTDPAAFKTAMNGVKLVYELATPTTTPLTSTENASIAALRTFEPQTHAQNNAQTDMAVDYTIRVPTIT